MPDQLATVIRLPVAQQLPAPPTCGECVNAHFGPRGVICSVLMDFVDEGANAEDCGEWTPQ